MRDLILMTVLSGSLFFSSFTEPDPEAILKKSRETCQSIEYGYYEMTNYMKFMSDMDTFSSSFNCYFRKLPEDTIYSFAFHYQHFDEGEYATSVLYTGDAFVNYSKKDSSGRIMSKALWADDIKSYSHNYTFYHPFTHKKSRPLSDDNSFLEDKHLFEYMGEEMINDVPCYHIRMSTLPDQDSTDFMKPVREEKNFWISKQDFIPVQYSIAYDMVMNNDTMYQYEKNVLTKYEPGHIKEEELSLSSVPSHIILKDYAPYKSPELLANDTFAPDWSLVSLDDETIALADLKGQLVLIDFFYKSCYPCLMALPALQDLHERYYDKGLRIIGINPFDTKEKDDIDNFLSKRGVTYTVLLGGKDVAKSYHVSGYPTIYLIDKNGKILFTQVGYGEGVKKVIEELIIKNL